MHMIPVWYPSWWLNGALPVHARLVRLGGASTNRHGPGVQCICNAACARAGGPESFEAYGSPFDPGDEIGVFVDLISSPGSRPSDAPELAEDCCFNSACDPGAAAALAASCLGHRPHKAVSSLTLILLFHLFSRRRSSMLYPPLNP